MRPAGVGGVLSVLPAFNSPTCRSSFCLDDVFSLLGRERLREKQDVRQHLYCIQSTTTENSTVISRPGEIGFASLAMYTEFH